MPHNHANLMANNAHKKTTNLRFMLSNSLLGGENSDSKGCCKLISYMFCFCVFVCLFCFESEQGEQSVLLTRNFKGGIRPLLTPVLTLQDGGHIGRHIWRGVIVPSDLVRLFDAIWFCTHYRYRMIHLVITYMRAWFKSTRKRQFTFNKIA